MNLHVVYDLHQYTTSGVEYRHPQVVLGIFLAIDVIPSPQVETRPMVPVLPEP